MDGASPTPAFFGAGETGAIIRAKDWSRTALGPIESWPQSLKTALSILLGSKMPMFVWWKAQEGLTIFYNDAYIPIAGDKHPDQIGADCWSAKGWAEMRPYLQPLVDQVFNEGEATWNANLLLPLYRQRGFLEEGYFSFSYSPVIGESGEIAGMFCATSETTKQVIGERRLMLLRNLGTGTALAASVDVANHAARQLAANPRDVPFALLYLVEANAERASLAAASLISAGTAASPSSIPLSGGEPPSVWPLHAVLQTGRMAHVRGIRAVLPASLPTESWSEPPDEAVILPIESPGQDQPIGFLVVGLSPRLRFDQDYESVLNLVAGHVATNLTNSRTVEAERKRARELAELDRAKISFFTNVSHEFRTPLALMLGPLEELRHALADRGDGPLRELAATVERNATRLLKLVNTLLHFGRIEGGRAEAWFEPTDLGAATAELASTFRSACERAGLRLTVECAETLPPVYVDRDAWEKIVLNLLSNGFKFTFRGEIFVGVRASLDGLCAETTVRDTGVGIPAGELGKLFGRFQRIEGVRGRSIEGSGIGLALVAELVKLHGGTIEASSDEGIGTAFTVRLPFGNAHLPADHVRRDAATTSRGPMQAAPFVGEALQWLPDGGAGEERRETDFGALGVDAIPATAPAGAQRILVADDNADLRAYLSRLLGSRYRLQTAADGEIALAAALSDPPDLVLADVMMPGLDGFELVARLRSDPRTRTLPIILLSARAGEEARVEGLAAGADDYLVKPFSARELLARVGAHLSTSQLRRDAEQAVRASEAQFRALVTATSDIVYRMSPDWTQMRYLRGQHFIADTLEPSSNWLMQYIPQDEQARVMAAIQRAIEARSVFELEHRVFRLDGSVGWTFSRAIPVVEGGEIVEWLGAASDVSPRKEADRRKDEFLATLAHELRNPLAPIRTGLQILRSPNVDAAVAARARATMERQLVRMVRLIDDLMDVSRISLGRIELKPAHVALREVIDQAIEATAPAVEASGIELFVRAIDPAIVVDADATRLSQVFANLLHNAAKYSERGARVEIGVASLGGDIRVSVADSGIGIESDMLPRVFDIFSQSSHSRDRAQGGLGIGLSIVKRLVELHGGRVEVSSAGIGHGSRFDVFLPRASPAADAAAAQAGSAGSGNSQAVSSSARLRILVADDNADAVSTLTDCLTIDGHEVLTARDGIEAIAAAEDFRPHVVLLDIGMPRLDGYDTCRQMREQAWAADALFIAVTGWGQDDDRRRSSDAGFDHHLVKPIDYEALEALLTEGSRQTMLQSMSQ